MSNYDLPPVIVTVKGKIRRVGVELELSELNLSELADAVIACFGGHSSIRSEFEIWIEKTEFGTFRLEYDSNYLKHSVSDELSSEFDEMASSALRKIFKNVSALEIISPPIDLNQLYRIDELISKLRCLGAKGTRVQTFRALGVHFNPEVISFEATSVLKYLKSFLCLHCWLIDYEKVDFARKVSPYIQAFPVKYVRMVIDPRYQPPLDLIIEDYLKYNPTRNRPLDMLPLFAYLMPELIQSKVSSDLVSARPTFHYRLPNSEVDDPDWSLARAWSGWIQVERLAADSHRLDEMSRLYMNHLDRLGFVRKSQWSEQVEQLLASIA